MSKSKKNNAESAAATFITEALSLGKAKKRAPAAPDAGMGAILDASLAAPAEPKVLKSWNANLGEREALARTEVAIVCDAIDGIEASAKRAAEAMNGVYLGGHHKTAGYANFAEWFLLAAAAIGRTPSPASVYRAVNAGEALRLMEPEAAAACSVPMDTLASFIGGLRKEKKSPDAMASALRTASKKFTEAKSRGLTSEAAKAEAGLVKAKTSTDSASTLDAESKAKRIADAAYALSGQSYAEALKILAEASDRLRAQQAAAVKAARGV